MNPRIKILYFIESLGSGGKERRLLELLSFLNNKTEYELKVVLTKKNIHYSKFLELGIPYEVIERRYIKKDPRLFFRFYHISKNFRPDIIHTWGNLVSFYALPSVIFQKIPLVNSQITGVPIRIKKRVLFKIMSSISFRFSKIILSNSVAGLKSYRIANNKGRVIYNGINLERFNNLNDPALLRSKYGLKTSFTVVMVASFSDYKDFDKYLDVCKSLNAIRKDVTFCAVGDGIHWKRIKKRANDEQVSNIVFTGKINDIEDLVNAADIGVLFTNKQVHGEGISNSIMEYMALCKPVIANDTGGTREIVEHEKSGYLITNKTPEEIAELIDDLLKNPGKRKKMSEAGRKIIEESFTLDKMGKSFEKVYKNVLSSKNTATAN